MQAVAGPITTPSSTTGNAAATRPRAYVRGTSPESPAVMIGHPATLLAEGRDTGGAFCLVESVLGPGQEPPPHIHEREDELLYLMEGEIDFYMGAETFKAAAGDAIFMPRQVPHAFRIRTPRVRVLGWFQPAGFEGFLHAMAAAGQAPAQLGELKPHATGDVAQLRQVAAQQFGIITLTPQEITEKMPAFLRS